MQHIDEQTLATSSSLTLIAHYRLPQSVYSNGRSGTCIAELIYGGRRRSRRTAGINAVKHP
jgi:hypothetical protein